MNDIHGKYSFISDSTPVVIRRSIYSLFTKDAVNSVKYLAYLNKFFLKIESYSLLRYKLKVIFVCKSLNRQRSRAYPLDPHNDNVHVKC